MSLLSAYWFYQLQRSVETSSCAWAWLPLSFVFRDDVKFSSSAPVLGLYWLPTTLAYVQLETGLFVPLCPQITVWHGPLAPPAFSAYVSPRHMLQFLPFRSLFRGFTQQSWFRFDRLPPLTTYWFSAECGHLPPALFLPAFVES